MWKQLNYAIFNKSMKIKAFDYTGGLVGLWLHIIGLLWLIAPKSKAATFL